jgi:mRNA interferase RelE/StbE
MMYQVEYSKRLEKFLDRIDNRLFARFERARLKLQENPYRRDLDIKKMRGHANDYRLRIGKYRFLYTIIENRLLIYMYKADTRGDVYKS